MAESGARSPAPKKKVADREKCDNPWRHGPGSWFNPPGGLLVSGQRASGLGVGERAPDFVAPLQGGMETRFCARAGGRPALLIFAKQPSSLIQTIGNRIEGRASFHLVVPEGVGIAEVDGADLFLDDGVVRTAFRLPDDDGIYAVLLDQNLRVLITACLDDEAAFALVDGRIDDVARTEPARTVTAQAPALFVPRVLEPALCEHLLNLWSASHVATGVEQSIADGRTEVIEADAKRRKDHVVEDPALIRVLTQAIGRRVIPEIRRSFAYAPDRFEGFKISCYEASSSGFFDGHRDNLSPSTAHRRFAMSLNLNSDYAGGELRFGEYGDDLYRPAAGEALIFACSMLHEVVPVREGRRFTLLSFLFDAESSQQGRRSGRPASPTPEE